MKRLHVLVTIFTAILLAGNLFVQAAVKEKKINKRYTVSNGDKLTVDNKYGKVHINTWDKNEVTVDIVIRTEAKNDDKAQDMMDRIKINEDVSAHEISYETKIKNNKISMTNNQKMNITYTINAPRRNTLDITNNFGDVYLDDFDGPLEMVVGYGALQTEKISGGNKYIKVSFGSATVSSLETGTVEVSYSPLNINTAQKIDVTNKFGKSTIGAVHDLEIDQQYGDLQLGTVDRINGSVSFAGMDIDHLQKSADMTLKYCGRADFGRVGSGVNMIKVNSSFSSLYCNIDEASLAVDIDISFGDITNRSKSATLTSSKAGAHGHKTNYSGKIGRGTGNMQITASYGNVTFN